MNWESLPLEIRLVIIKKRNKIRQTAAKMIQKQWNKFQAPKQTTIYLWEKLKADNPDDWESDYPSMIFPETARLIDFTNKVLSGKENQKYWAPLFSFISYGLWINEYAGGPGAVYHNKIDDSIESLEKKFNVAWRRDFRNKYLGLYINLINHNEYIQDAI